MHLTSLFSILTFFSLACILSGESPYGPAGTPLTCHCYGDPDCSSTGSHNPSNNTCIENQYCYALWTNDSNGVVVKKRGCWANTENCKISTCVHHGKPQIQKMKQKTAAFFFCCCNTNFCNEKLSLEPDVHVERNTTLPTQSSKYSGLLLTVDFSLLWPRWLSSSLGNSEVRCEVVNYICQ